MSFLTAHGPADRNDKLITLPNNVSSLDDFPFYRVSYTPPSEVLQQWIEEWEAIRAENGFFDLTVHPRVGYGSGSPARVDVVPPSLPLAHAALVTRWGHHEQMLALHNLFRRLCHTPDCGALPPTRPAGRHYRWQRFGSAAEAVAGELHRYNTHPAYLAFRQARAERRRARQPLAGLALLALGLCVLDGRLFRTAVRV